MDISEIKKLIRKSTSVLVMDNGEPSFVVLGYQMYKDLVSGKVEEKEIKINQVGNGSSGAYSSHERETEILERLNKDILALKSQIEMEERGMTGVSGRDVDPALEKDRIF